MRPLSFFLVFSLIVHSAAAQSRLQNDFDGDGVSDIVLVTIAQDQTLSWQVISGATSALLFEQTNFGALGDNLAPAAWMEPGKALLAYQSLQGRSIIWTLLRSDRSTSKITLGTVGKGILAGADFNGDRIADAAAVREMRGGNYEWAARSGPFTGAPTAISPKVRFGKTGDYAFYASLSGKGDWFGTARANDSPLHVWLRHPLRRVTRHFKIADQMPAGFKILPLKQSKGGDLLAVVSQNEGNTSVVFVTPRGREVGRTMFAGVGEVLVGDFMNDPGEELAIQDPDDFTVYNPIMRTTKVTNWGSGIPVDAINIVKFSQSGPGITPTVVPTPDDRPPEDNPTPPAGSLASVCTKMHAMDRSVLYKPGSGGTNDARTGKPAFLWYELPDNPHVMKLYVLASNGRMIAIFGFYNVGQPFSRFYSGYSPGTGQTGGELASLAQSAAGSKAVYFYTKNGNCWGPVPDPRVRTAGR